MSQSLARSPIVGSSSVLRLEMKINREEGVHLQKENDELQMQSQSLRAEIKRLKEETNAEIRMRKRLVAEAENDHIARVNDAQREFAVAKVKAQDARAHAAAEQLSLLKQATRALKNVCARGKEIVAASITDVRRQAESAKAAVREPAVAERNPEVAELRKMAQAMQETYDVMPNAGAFTGLPRKPRCVVSEVTAFEVPGEDGGLEAAPKEREVQYIPEHLVRTMRWIGQCLR